MFAHMLHACGLAAPALRHFPEKLHLCLGFFEFVLAIASEAKRYWVRSLNYWSHKTLESNISDPLLSAPAALTGLLVA